MTESMEIENIDSVQPELSAPETNIGASDAEELEEEKPKCFLALRSQVAVSYTHLTLPTILLV